MENLAELETEGRNPRTMEMDTLAPSELISLLHRESLTAFTAVEGVLPHIAQVVELIAERMERGGRLFYVGAGTSGRLGVLDASECPPTFGIAPDRVQGIIAGGDTALKRAVEGAEDSPEQGRLDLRAHDIAQNDVVIGIAASGRTPYVIGALQAAREAGAVTVAIANVTGSRIGKYADYILEAVTGPEALTGSTRLKAGTAQKLILNLITTGAMVRLGKVYGNLMVDVQATNAKLRDRAARIVMAAAEVEREAAEAALQESNGNVKTAIVMLLRGVSFEMAEAFLTETHDRVRLAVTI